MYITETTNNVKDLFEKLDIMEDIKKLEIFISIFNLVNNNQINNKNEANPNLIEDDNLLIFNLDNIGFASNYCTMFLQHNLSLYNSMTNSNKLYEKDGNVMGFDYSKDVVEFISSFEKLSFNEKLDVIAELVIRYDNETLLKNFNGQAMLDSNRSGFELAREIQKIKE